jgi:hypothetical protein
MGLAASGFTMKEHRVTVSGSPHVFKGPAAGLKGLRMDLGNVLQGFPSIFYNGLPERIGNTGKGVHVHEVSLGTMPT